jgi:hypothetical protein
MRIRILLFAALAAIIAVLTACGPSNGGTNVRGESSAAAPSNAAGSPHHTSSHAHPVAVSSGHATHRGAHAKHGGTATGPATKPPANPPSASSDGSAYVNVSAIDATIAGSALFSPAAASEDPTYNLNIDPDGKALTILFSNRVASVGDTDPGVPNAAPAFDLSLPLTDDGQNSTATFYASGYAFVTKGATAHLMFSACGHTIAKTFGAGTDHDFVLPLELTAVPGSQCLVSFVLGADQASGT